MEPPDDIVDELYGAPFAEFIPLRDARAKELRREKRRDEADAVKQLRKPVLSAWAVDQLSRRDRDLVDELLAAGAALRQAKGGDVLRDATREERGAVARASERAEAILREHGHTVSDKTAAEIRNTLHAVAADEETRDLVARGRLAEPRQAIGLGGFAAAGPAPDRAEPEAHPKPGRRKRTAKKDGAAARREHEAEERRAAKEREAEERRAAKEREKAARRALRDAEAALRKRERELAAAEKAVAEARGEVERRRTELEEWQSGA